MRNLERSEGDDANAAVAMFRRALELSVRILEPKAPSGLSLFQRIERLPADLVTPAMKGWATHVRLGGNDALHDPEEFTLEEATTLRTFTEMFLTYAFTLPKMLERAQPPAQT